MPTVLDLLGTSTPVSEQLAQKIGLVRAAIACRVFFYQQLKDGVCSASVNTLSDKLGLASGTISTNLKWLRANNYIVCIGYHRKGNVPNKYKVGPAFYEGIKPEHSLDESEHSLDESNIQQMNGKEEVEEDFKYNTTNKENSNFFELYQTNFGFYSSVQVDELKEYESNVQAGWFEEAIKRSIDNGARKWSYCRVILNDFIKAGRITELRQPKQSKAKGSNNGHTQLDPTNPDDWATMLTA